MIIFGIDPSETNGGVFWRRGDDYGAQKMVPLRQLNDLILELKGDDFAIVFIEEINLRVNDRKQMRKINGARKVMAHFEQLKAMMVLNGLTYVVVHPRRWQKHLEKNHDVFPWEHKNPKNAYKEFAQLEYPEIKKVTLHTADAICLGHCGREWLRSQPKWLIARTYKNGRDF